MTNLGLFRRWLLVQKKTDFIGRVPCPNVGEYVNYMRMEMEKYHLIKVRSINVETIRRKQLGELLNAPDKRTFIGINTYIILRDRDSIERICQNFSRRCEALGGSCLSAIKNVKIMEVRYSPHTIRHRFAVIQPKKKPNYL